MNLSDIFDFKPEYNVCGNCCGTGEDAGLTCPSCDGSGQSPFARFWNTEQVAAPLTRETLDRAMFGLMHPVRHD